MICIQKLFILFYLYLSVIVFNFINNSFYGNLCMSDIFKGKLTLNCALSTLINELELCELNKITGSVNEKKVLKLKINIAKMIVQEILFGNGNNATLFNQDTKRSEEFDDYYQWNERFSQLDQMNCKMEKSSHLRMDKNSNKTSEDENDNKINEKQNFNYLNSNDSNLKTSNLNDLNSDDENVLLYCDNKSQNNNANDLIIQYAEILKNDIITLSSSFLEKILLENRVLN